jgi:hypothetical protein
MRLEQLWQLDLNLGVSQHHHCQRPFRSRMQRSPGKRTRFRC